LSGGDNQGGYGVVHMVQIDHIPNTIKLTKKTPKMDDKREAHKTMISESFGMPLKTSRCHQIPCHPHKDHGGIHIMVEWGTIQEMLNYNMKYSPAMDNHTLL